MPKARSTMDISAALEEDSASSVEIFMINSPNFVDSPRSSKKKAPKSLPDVSRIRTVDNCERIGMESFVRSSPSKLGELILLYGADRAITDAPEVMKRLVEPCILSRVNRLTDPKNKILDFDEGDALTEEDRKVLLSDFATAMNHKMISVLEACIKKFAYCDTQFLKDNCPSPIPVTVLLEIYELKAAYSKKEGVAHYVSIDEEEDTHLCNNCGFVQMAKCNKCSRVWCVNRKCLLEYEQYGEPICLFHSSCEKCNRPIQTDTFAALKRGFCDCGDDDYHLPVDFDF